MKDGRHEDVSLTAAGVGHGGVIAALHNLCFERADGPAWDAKTATDLLAMAGAFAFIACRADRPVGFALARRAADESEIIAIGVIPVVRRQGVAAMLLDGVIEKAAAAGGGRIFLEVAVDNEPALGLYRRRGFALCGRRAGYYQRRKGPVDAHILALDMTAEK